MHRSGYCPKNFGSKRSFERQNWLRHRRHHQNCSNVSNCHARTGTSKFKIKFSTSFILKLSQVFSRELYIEVSAGMISRILFTDEVACVTADVCSDACGSSIACANTAYPTLVLRLLPAGLRGLLMAVLLAALMSSLTSTFNSGATLFTLGMPTYSISSRRENVSERTQE